MLRVLYYMIFWQRIRPFVIHSYDPRDVHLRGRRRDTFGAIIVLLLSFAIHSPALCEAARPFSIVHSGLAVQNQPQEDLSFYR